MEWVLRVIKIQVDVFAMLFLLGIQIFYVCHVRIILDYIHYLFCLKCKNTSHQIIFFQQYYLHSVNQVAVKMRIVYMALIMSVNVIKGTLGIHTINVYLGLKLHVLKLLVDEMLFVNKLNLILNVYARLVM